MNSLANLNSVVDEQGDSTTWPSDHGWDPPVATICTGPLSDSRLHFHHSANPRQEWDWTDSQMILAPHYATEEDELDCKQGILQVEAMGGASGLGLRQYSSGFMAAAAAQSMNTPSLGGGGTSTAAPQSSWPGSLLNAVPLRQHITLPESSGGNCYSPPAVLYGGGMGSNVGLNAGGYYNSTAHQGHMPMDMEQRRLHDILKRGMYSAGTAADFGAAGARLGLNLGGRTYFSTEDMGARFHLAGHAGKRFRPNSPSMHVPSCQAEGCKADLSIAKHYHRRHKVCEYHSKAATVIITGNTQRFCQQCSRFHALSEFDEGKRSCRKRLADHNRRRRKPQPAPALPAPDSSSPVSTMAGASSNVDNPASNQNEDQSQDTKPGTAVAARSQSDQQGEKQSKEVCVSGTKTASSSSTEQQTTSLLSTMTLAPSVSLTLQNGGGRAEMQSNQSSNMQVSSQQDHHSNEKEAAYMNERHSAAPYLLNGPSLSLSSTGVSVGGPNSVPSANDQSPAHATHTFNEIELSVPWLRGHHVCSSPRMGVVQEGLGKLSSCHQAAEGSFMYSCGSRRNGKGQYFNEHGRLLAEHLQSLRSQAALSAQDNHMEIKKENWVLESAGVAHEDQTVLSLLETATGNGSRKKEPAGDSDDYNRHLVNVMDAEAHERAGARHPLGFLQGHNHHHDNHHHHHHHHQQTQQQQQQHAGGFNHNTASPSEMDHEASDAALSLHCMQVLRPLNESLYTTADFMKDGFLSS